MNKWVVKQQAYLGQVMEESLPNAAEWAERQGQSLVTAYNLTQVSSLHTAPACVKIWKSGLAWPAGGPSAYSGIGVIEARVGHFTNDWPEFPP